MFRSASFTLLIGCLLAVVLSAQTYRPPRTGSLLLGDRAGNRVLYLHDSNLDKDYDDAGEISVWYTGVNGVVPTTIQDLAFGPDGTAYLSDSGTDTILALNDFNFDGNADSAGETQVYFSTANASGVSFAGPMGITIVPDFPAPVIWIANASNGAVNLDGLIRCQDLNGDGDAEDAGEAVIWWNKALSILNGGPDLDIPACVVVDDQFRVLVLHGSGAGAAKGVYRLSDNGGTPGANDAGEVSLYWAVPTNGQTPVAFEMGLRRDGSVWVMDRGNNDSMYVLNDLNFDNSIDASEFTTYWAAGAPSLVDNMTEVIDWDGLTSFVVCEDNTPDRLFRLSDLDFSGTITNAVEQTTIYDETTIGVLDIGQPKAIAAFPGPFLDGPATVQPGLPVTITHSGTKAHLFTLALSLSSAPAVIPPFGLFLLDPFYTLVLVNVQLPGSGSFSISSGTPPLSSLIGITLYLQSVELDATTAYLSNLYTLTFI